MLQHNVVDHIKRGGKPHAETIFRNKGERNSFFCDLIWVESDDVFVNFVAVDDIPVKDRTAYDGAKTGNRFTEFSVRF